MFKQSNGRSQRSKGVKVKHVLQICLLLAICFWLVYQVKHSHDKKREFDESGAKITQRTQSSSEILNLGRKDLHPKVEGTSIVSKKQDDEAEEEEIVEEEENKHQGAEQEHKSEEQDGEGRGGDEGIDEHEQEKIDADVDREEEIIDEEKEKEEGDEKESEENDSEDNNGQLEQENSLEEHDDDDEGTAKSTHEAREEHYKADDASSAVTHESQTVIDENGNENENGNSDNSNEARLSNENEINNTEKDDIGVGTTNSKTQEREMIENGGLLNTTANGAMENGASKSEDIFSPNSALIEQSNDNLSVTNKMTNAVTWSDGSSMQNGTETQNSHMENVAVGVATGDGSGFETVVPDQGNNSNLSSRDNKADSKLAVSTETGETDSSVGKTSETHNRTVSVVSEESTNSSVLAVDNSGSSTMGGNNSTVAENADTDDGTGRMADAAFETENPNEIQNDPIDSSDSSIALEKVRTDLETLPEIHTEGSTNEDTASE